MVYNVAANSSLFLDQESNPLMERLLIQGKIQ
jgi:hypothetical protein